MKKNRVYWFMYNTFVRAWNNFKEFIGHPRDPDWIRWLVVNIPGYYPKEMEIGSPEYKVKHREELLEHSRDICKAALNLIEIIDSRDNAIIINRLEWIIDELDKEISNNVKDNQD